jgi:LysM repeat protein
MREKLLRQRRLLAAVAIGVGVLAAGGAALLVVAGVLGPTAEPPPQAPRSAVAPTLLALATAEATTQTASSTQTATAEGTPEPSPFASIAQPPPQPPQRVAPVHHSVTEGEVLWEIAEQYNLRPETLLWANDIQDPDLLLVGQELLIPPTDGVLYTVRPGDRLVDVADRYGVDLQSIVTSNLLDDPDQIQAGVDIFLPGGRPLSPTTLATDAAQATEAVDEQAIAATNATFVLPDNIEAMLTSGWLAARRVTNLYKTAAPASAHLHQLPGGARLERLSGVTAGRIQVRDPGDGRTRQAMTGWVDAVDLDVGRAPATRELPQAYPADTAMDIYHIFAPYRSQLDGSPYAEANCGPTALGMALNAFDVDVSGRQLRGETLDAQHMYGNGVGTLITALAQVVEENGLSALDLRNDSGALHRWNLDDIRDAVHDGHPVIVQVRYRSLPGRGGAYYFGDHYILVTGVVGDGFLYNDPIDVDGLGWDRVISGATLRVAMNASDQRYAYSAVAVGR